VKLCNALHRSTAEENPMNDVAAARDRLESAQQELAEVEARAEREVAQAAVQVREAQAAADAVHRAVLAESARAWADHALELVGRAAEAAGDDVQTVTGVVLRRDGTAEPYVQLVFSRDVLAGRAAEAQAKAERLRAFAAQGGLQSDDLTRVVDEQAGLPEAVLEPSAA
jgi:hypothetical protein